MSKAPPPLRIERHKLVFMGLVALDEVAEHCIRDTYPRTFALRVTLAMLYAFSDGTREPYDDFWRECAAPDSSDNRQMAMGMRSNAVHSTYHRICRTLGVADTIRFRSDVDAARRDSGPHARAYDALHRALQSEGEAARQRFAEMLRISTRERNDAREQGRQMRACKLSG
ncbi:hypothetical protein [Sphingomonas crusticola]|uniref:hypothetical protein n=1 Tax=Sphingomonas crusticola TaxID=1697973 RepID=UPI000E2211E8|nr:hypothetical protein [Sphingomonas crusticola]